MTAFNSVLDVAMSSLLLKYSAYIEIKLPNELADKLQSGEIEFTDHWGCIQFQQDGQDVKIEGEVVDVDYKHCDSFVFEVDESAARWQKYVESIADNTDISNALVKGPVPPLASPSQDLSEKNIITHVKDAVCNQEDKSHRTVPSNQHSDKKGSCRGNNKGKGRSSGASVRVSGAAVCEKA